MSGANGEPSLVLDARDVARLLRMGHRSAQRFLARLPSFVLGRRRVILRETLLRELARLENEGAGHA